MRTARARAARYVRAVNEAATALFKTIATAYLAAGSPDRATHHFEHAQMTDMHRELEAEGVIQRVFGVPGGFAWRLTEAGAELAAKSAR